MATSTSTPSLDDGDLDAGHALPPGTTSATAIAGVDVTDIGDEGFVAFMRSKPAHHFAGKRAMLPKVMWDHPAARIPFMTSETLYRLARGSDDARVLALAGRSTTGRRGKATG